MYLEDVAGKQQNAEGQRPMSKVLGLDADLADDGHTCLGELGGRYQGQRSEAKSQRPMATEQGLDTEIQMKG